MSSYVPGGLTLGFKPGGTIAKNVLVMLDSTVDQVVVTTGITSPAIGASLNSSTSTGDEVAVQVFGVAKLTAVGVIALGAEVMPSAGGAGKIDTAAGATARSVGIALEAAAADGDVIRVLLNLSTKGPANA